jgi:hypothetical protein
MDVWGISLIYLAICLVSAAILIQIGEYINRHVRNMPMSKHSDDPVTEKVKEELKRRK